MPIPNTLLKAKRSRCRYLIQTTIVYCIFCILSLLSQRVYPVFGLVVMMGIILPLVWARVTDNWIEMGFTIYYMKPALLWGGIVGIISGIIGVAVVPQVKVANKLGLQLALGIPMWALMISPFQEFFFRGWLQSRFAMILGKWRGLILANVCFTLWHYCAPFVTQSPVPLKTPLGALSTFIVGLLYGYTFMRTRNIIAPWLAHILAGITFIIIGAMDFTQYQL